MTGQWCPCAGCARLAVNRTHAVCSGAWNGKGTPVSCAGCVAAAHWSISRFVAGAFKTLDALSAAFGPRCDGGRAFLKRHGAPGLSRRRPGE